MMVLVLLKREGRLLYTSRMRLAVLAAYPLLLLLTGALALDLPQQGADVRIALLVLAFVLLPLNLVGMAWHDDLTSGTLLQLRQRLLSAVWARYLALLLGIMLPLTSLLLAISAVLLRIVPLTLLVPMLLTLPSLTGLLLLVAALVPERGPQTSLAALLLLPLAVPIIVLLTLATTGAAEIAAAASWWLGAAATLSLGLLPPVVATALRQKLAS